MSVNDQSVVNQGEFHSSVRHSKPMKHGGHEIGSIHTESDRIPTFSAETLPPGTAPKDAIFQPNPRPEDMGGMYQSASSTLTGSDSGTTYTGLGHPGQGQTSSELRHDGQQHRKRQGLGTVGLGEVGQSQKEVNPQDPQFANQRALDQDYPTGKHLK